MSIFAWKNDIVTQWESLDLEEFCSTLCINYEESFLKPINLSSVTQNPFDGFKFSWLPHSMVKDGLLHLHPIEVSNDQVTWEEWFVAEGVLHHHILWNYTYRETTDSWLGNDEDHPKTICDVLWHYFNDTDIRPMALR